jgi:hypothetical protein
MGPILKGGGDASAQHASSRSSTLRTAHADHWPPRGV